MFVRFDDAYGDLLPFPFGAQVKNPFKGAARFFAGDLIEMRYDDKVENPEMYILKTYEVVSAEGTTVNIVRDGYHHIPFVGDILTVAPDTIGGKGEALTVIAVAKGTADSKNVWALTLAAAPSTAPNAGDILVEADAEGNMVVKNVNAVADCDYDFLFNPAADPSDDDEFEKARYFFTPAVGGTMYKYRMSPIPACVEKLNLANVNGWFRVDARVKPATLQVAQ